MEQKTESGKAAGAPAPLELKAETLSGDIRDWMLDQLRRVDKPWTKLKEAEQRRIIEGAEDMGRQAVRRALDIFLAYDFPTLSVAVGKYAGKDGTLKAEFTCQDTDDNLIAVARAGRAVLIIAEPDTFFGQRRTAKAEPDQREMDLAAAKEAGETIDPETGEVIIAGPPEGRLSLPGPTDGLPPEEAQRRFEAAKEAALTKKQQREKRADEQARVNSRARNAGAIARKAGEPREFPAAMYGKPEANAWLAGFDDENAALSRKGATAAAGDAVPVGDATSDAFERGRAAFLEGKPGMVPDDLSGTADHDEAGTTSQESVASAKRNRPGAAMPAEPAREPAEA